MKVSNIELELQEYGASAGMRAVVISVSTTADDMQPNEVITELKTKLGDQLFEDMCIGKLHIIFKGDDIDPAHDDVRETLMEFLQEGLSKTSLDIQVNQLKLATTQLRPPFIEIFTNGEIFTGQDMFFENFNYVVCELDPNVAPKQAFALVEISKHAFSTFVFRVKAKEDWEAIQKKFIEPQYVAQQLARVFLVPADGTKAEMESYLAVCAELALETGARCGNHLAIATAS